MEPGFSPMTNPAVSDRSGFKKYLKYIVIVVVSAVLAGGGVWFFMSQQNNNEKTSLNAQITTKEKSISTLQNKVTTLEKTPIATKTTTTTSSGIQNSAATGLYESLVNFCKTDNKTVGFATLSNGMTNGKNDQYFGSCSVSPVGAITGGYILTAMYDNSKWTQLFGGQAPTEASQAMCVKYHFPTQLDTCS